MNCKHAQQRLAILRSDEELPSDLAKHLSECTDCESWMASERDMWELLGQYSTPPYRETDARDVLMRARSSPPLGWWQALEIPGLAASFGVAILGTVGGAWCGDLLVDRLLRQQTTASPVTTGTEGGILSVAPTGSIVELFLESQTERER